MSSTGEPGANRPQTSANEELFDRTLMTERAYARPYLSLRAPGRRRMWRVQPRLQFPLVSYRYRRVNPMQRVHNVAGKYAPEPSIGSRRMLVEHGSHRGVVNYGCLGF